MRRKKLNLAALLIAALSISTIATTNLRANPAENQEGEVSSTEISCAETLSACDLFVGDLVGVQKSQAALIVELSRQVDTAQRANEGGWFQPILVGVLIGSGAALLLR